jgi:heme A synthase
VADYPKLKDLGMMTMKIGNALETIAILLALISIMPIAYWQNMDELSQHRQYLHRQYLYYLFFVLCLLGYVTYRKVRRLRARLKSSKKQGSGPP